MTKPNPNSELQCREAFEKWYMRQFARVPAKALNCDAHDGMTYGNIVIESRWEGFRAAWDSRADHIPDAGKMVPELLKRADEWLEAENSGREGNKKQCARANVLIREMQKALIQPLPREVGEEDVERVARAIQKDFPVLRTGPDEKGDWCARPLEIEVFMLAAERALAALQKPIKGER